MRGTLCRRDSDRRHGFCSKRRSCVLAHRERRPGHLRRYQSRFGTGLTKGNLSSQLAKLEHAKYVEIEKTFRATKAQAPLRLVHDRCVVMR